MKEKISDGVIYVWTCHLTGHLAQGDASGFWNNFDQKEREEIERNMVKKLVEMGYLIKKSDLEKQNSIYKENELFYGI
jgi:hypothetical protein